MAKADVEVVIKGTDKASGVLSGISGKMQGMSSTFRTAGMAMMGVGVALGGGLFALANKTATMGDEVAKMAQRTGFAVETLSELRHVAQISGTELGSIEKATKRMSSAILDASDGMETYIRAFDHLGINIQELKGLTPEEQFWKIAYALAELEDDTMKAALAQDIFGRAGTDLFPMLEEGAAGIANLRQEAHDLGVVFNDESAKEAVDMKDALTDLTESLGGVAKEIVTVLIPDITKFAEKAVEIVKSVREWIGANPQLVTGLKILVGILVGGGGVLIALSQISKAIIAVNAALVILHALSGPAGWIKLAAGLAIAGGAIFAMTKLLGGKPTAEGEEGLTEFQKGHPPESGWRYKYPGGVGGPEYELEKMRHGGIITRPTRALIGEAGPEAVVPLRGAGGFGETNIYVTVQGSVITEEQLSETIYEKLLKRKARNVSLELA